MLNASTLFAGALVLALPTQAQEAPSDAQVDQLTLLARAALPMARLEDGSNVPPETDAELARPIVPRALEVQTVARGMLSARMEACALDWRQASYLPYMRALRGSGRYAGKQMAYLGLLHGMSQGMTGRALSEAAEPCPAAARANLPAEAAGRTIETP